MSIDRIRKLINPDPEVLINVGYDNKTQEGLVTIEERDPGASLNEVKLRGVLYPDIVALKLDVPGKRITSYLNPGEEFINKACDCIAFLSVEDSNYILFCELKSKSVNMRDCLIKFRNSRCFARYLLSLVEEFYPSELEQFKDVYVLFDQKKKTQKTLTKGRKITSTRVNGDYIYLVRHLKNNEFLNVRHLDL